MLGSITPVLLIPPISGHWKATTAARRGPPAKEATDSAFVRAVVVTETPLECLLLVGDEASSNAPEEERDQARTETEDATKELAQALAEGATTPAKDEIVAQFLPCFHKGELVPIKGYWFLT